MKIHNVRLGLANNSSSSHSLIFLKGAKDLDDDVDHNEFGWSNFTAGSEEAKRSYLALTLDRSLRSITSPEMAEAIVNAWAGRDADPDGHVDHQSVYAMPLTWDEKGIDKQFFDEFKAFLLQENLAILGGNDNDNTKHPLDNGKSFTLDLLRDGSPNGMVARKDQTSNYWMIFNRNNGTKIRFSFDQKAKAPTKADFPELVDLKITDYCPFDCSYCLDGSTPVLKSNLDWAPISSLKEGDELFAFDETVEKGTKDRRIRKALVKNVWKTLKHATKITTDRGEIICSSDHQWLMSHTHRWLKTKDLKLGHEISFSTSPWGDFVENDAFMKGYLSGLSCGDGTSRWLPKSDWVKGQPGQVYWSVRLKDREPLDRAAKYLLNFGFSIQGVKDYYPEYNGEKLHYYRLEERSTKNVKKLQSIVTLNAQSADKDYQRGWLSGFFDSEGSHSFNGRTVRFSQKKTNLFLHTVEKFLHSLGFKCTKVLDQEVRLLGGRWAAVSLFGQIRPAISRKWDALFVGGMKSSKAKVLKLETLPEQELVDIETSTGTFIANGLASHNCYQNSTSKGQHADARAISSLVRVLEEAKVPEVAIGGGEPTLHPKFIEILENFRSSHIVPNFTTKNLAWLRDFEVWPKIMKNCGSFAYSATDSDEVEKFSELLTRNKIAPERVCVQYVMGSTEMYEFESILETAGKHRIPVTLLGYKTTGRGHEYQPKDHSNWITVLKKLAKNYFPVRIDTALALEFEDELKKNKIPSWMYHTKEGKFSLYIDAVKGKIGPSSYCESILMRSVDLEKMRVEQLGKLYRHF